MTKLDCSALRCLAIVSIMLHNYSHWLPGAVQENEYTFRLGNYFNFWSSIMRHDFLIQLFSFWGHLGVPVFVFLTGYGLSQKYDKYDSIEVKSFIYKHYKKLFVPLAIGSICYILVMLAMGCEVSCSMYRIVAQLFMLLNIVSPYHLQPIPYWYFGLTMQFYLIYILLIYKRSLAVLIVLTALSLFFMFFLIDYPHILMMVKFNSIGWLLPLCMGIAYSRLYIKLSISGNKLAIVAFVSLILIIIMGFNYYLWLFISVAVVIFYMCIVKLLPQKVNMKLDYVGRNSMYYFVVHPIAREIGILLVPTYGRYIGMFIYLFICAFIVWLISKTRILVQ